MRGSEKTGEEGREGTGGDGTEEEKELDSVDKREGRQSGNIYVNSPVLDLHSVSFYFT